MKYVKTCDWLVENLNQSETRIVDCRFSLAETSKGKESYLAGHIPGAVFFDLEKDLSKPIEEHGGRHPLPDIGEFVHKLESVGINENRLVIVYDDGEGSFAARFWWMLTYLGHERVFVLDGGLNEWNNRSYPMSTEIPLFKNTVFQINEKTDMLAKIDDVKKTVQTQSTKEILIDSREEQRYLGIVEPIDKKAGHIPGAINKPWTMGLQQGLYKSKEEQAKRFADIDRENTVIVYCGSGVTATPNFLALKEAGFEKVKLYVGSFSDWISYPENKVN